MKRNFKKRWNILQKLWLPFVRNNISAHAAGACYYIVLSLLPAIALGLTVFSLLPVSLADWGRFLESALPDRLQPIADYLLGFVAPRRPGALLSLWAVLTLWSASKGVMAITDGLADVLSCELRRGFIRRRLDAMIDFLLLFASLPVTFAVQVLGEWFFFRLLSLKPQLHHIFMLFYRLRHLYALLILSCLFALLYWLLPGRPLPFLFCWQSGFFSAAGWLAATGAFSVYVNYFQSYQKIYGSLGLLLLAGLWLLICIRMLLYGAVLGRLIRERSYHPIRIIKELFS